jgi:hypothetical protein
MAKQEGTITLPSVFWGLEHSFFIQLARFVVVGKSIEHQVVLLSTGDEEAAFTATRFLAGSKVNIQFIQSA